jgi:hypothetical protein
MSDGRITGCVLPLEGGQRGRGSLPCTTHSQARVLGGGVSALHYTLASPRAGRGGVCLALHTP